MKKFFVLAFAFLLLMKANSQTPESTFNKIMASIINSNFDSAAKAISGQLKLRPGDADLFFLEGYYYKMKGELDSALVSFNKSAGLLKDKSKRFKTGETYSDPILEKGDIFFRISQNDSALAANDLSISLHPGAKEGYWARGYLKNWSLNDHAGALKDYSEAIRIDDKYMQAYYDRAILLKELGRPQEAIKDYTRLLELSPGSPVVYFDRGLIYIDLKNYELALRDYDEAIKLEPNEKMCYYNRAVIKSFLDRPDDALQDCDKAIAIDDKYTVAYLKKVEIYMSKNDFSTATAISNKTVAMDPENAEVYVYRGLLKTMNGDAASAIPDFNKAINLDPANLKAYVNKELAWARMGIDPNQRITLLRKALELDPNCAIAYHNLAVAYQEKRDYSYACQNLKKAIQLGLGKNEMAAARKSFPECF